MSILPPPLGLYRLCMRTVRRLYRSMGCSAPTAMASGESPRGEMMSTAIQSTSARSARAPAGCSEITNEPCTCSGANAVASRRRQFDVRRARPALPGEAMSDVENEDPLDDPGYQEFLAETAKTCRARDKPCPGCCAGGMCDGFLGGRFSEDYEDEEHDNFDEDELTGLP